MIKYQKSWTREDIIYLTNNYGKLPTKQIAVDLIRTYDSVKSMAIKRLKLKHSGIYKNNLNVLFENTNENWYWLGFIAADGNLNNQYLNITVHPNDKDHLQILANKLNVNINFTNKGYPTIGISDTKNIKKLKIKLGQTEKGSKTYNPLNINYNISKENYLSFIIGFIDGDGCIEVRNNKMSQLKIECHGSWFNNLVIISEFLQNNYNIPSRTIITNRGYTLWKITSHKNGVALRNLVRNLNIPYLKRKWDKFNDSLEYTNFYKDIESNIIKLYKEGYNLHKISKMLNVNYHSLCNHKKELLTKI